MSEIDFDKTIALSSAVVGIPVVLTLWFEPSISNRSEQFLTLLAILSLSAVVIELLRMGITTFLTENTQIESDSFHVDVLWQVLYLLFTALIGTGDGSIEDLFFFVGFLMIFPLLILKYEGLNSLTGYLYFPIYMFITLFFTFISTIVIIQRGNLATLTITVGLAGFAIILSVVHSLRN